MAGPIQILDVTYQAGVDLSSAQYAVVVAGNADECKLPAAAGEGKVLGILQNFPASGSAARVRKLGISKVNAGATISYGEQLEIANSSGDVQAYTMSGSNGLVGSAEEDAVDNDIFRAFIMPIDISDIV